MQWVGPAQSFAEWFVKGGGIKINPAQVAQSLIAKAPLATANANIAPPPTFHTYVHYMNWLWVDQGQWKPVSVSLGVGGANVTLTGAPKYVTWSMGDGDTLVCNGAGWAWQDGTPNDTQSPCQYAYNKMTNPYGDKWTISAQITYGLSWTCTGACGGQVQGNLADITAPAGNPTSITVYQRRAVITQ